MTVQREGVAPSAGALKLQQELEQYIDREVQICAAFTTHSNIALGTEVGLQAFVTAVVTSVGSLWNKDECSAFFEVSSMLHLVDGPIQSVSFSPSNPTRGRVHFHINDEGKRPPTLAVTLTWL